MGSREVRVRRVQKQVAADWFEFLVNVFEKKDKLDPFWLCHNINISVSYLIENLVKTSKIRLTSREWYNLSKNIAVSMQDIKDYIFYPWDWKGVSSNPNLTLDFVLAHPEKGWSWLDISSNQNIKLKDIIEHMDLPWYWPDVSKNPNITMQFVLENIDKSWNWVSLSVNPAIKLIDIENNLDKNWSWPDILSNRNLTLEFVKKYMHKVLLTNGKHSQEAYIEKLINRFKTILNTIFAPDILWQELGYSANTTINTPKYITACDFDLLARKRNIEATIADIKSIWDCGYEIIIQQQAIAGLPTPDHLVMYSTLDRINECIKSRDLFIDAMHGNKYLPLEIITGELVEDEFVIQETWLKDPVFLARYDELTKLDTVKVVAGKVSGEKILKVSAKTPSDKLLWKLSENYSITLEFIKTHPEINWAFLDISFYGNITIKDVLDTTAGPHVSGLTYNWDWVYLTINTNISIYDIIHNIDKPWAWNLLQRKELNVERNNYIVNKYRRHLAAYRIQQHWHRICTDPRHPFCQKRLERDYDSIFNNDK